MGLNRIVLHPKYGSFIQLSSILIDAELDEYSWPLAENPCIKLHLCAAVCPTGAITKDEPFDFFACSTHCYRDKHDRLSRNGSKPSFLQGHAEYRSRYNDSETASCGSRSCSGSVIDADIVWASVCRGRAQRGVSPGQGGLHPAKF